MVALGKPIQPGDWPVMPLATAGVRGFSAGHADNPRDGNNSGPCPESSQLSLVRAAPRHPGKPFPVAADASLGPYASRTLPIGGLEEEAARSTP